MANWILVGGPMDGEMIALEDNMPQEHRLFGCAPIAYYGDPAAVIQPYDLGVYRRTKKLAQRGELHWVPAP